MSAEAAHTTSFAQPGAAAAGFAAAAETLRNHPAYHAGQFCTCQCPLHAAEGYGGALLTRLLQRQFYCNIMVLLRLPSAACCSVQRRSDTVDESG
jgi:hypothetical protein